MAIEILEPTERETPEEKADRLAYDAAKQPKRGSIESVMTKKKAKIEKKLKAISEATQNKLEKIAKDHEEKVAPLGKEIDRINAFLKG